MSHDPVVLLIFLPLYPSGFSDMDYVMPVKMKYVTLTLQTLSHNTFTDGGQSGILSITLGY